jgi:hypothetical protein
MVIICAVVAGIWWNRRNKTKGRNIAPYNESDEGHQFLLPGPRVRYHELYQQDIKRLASLEK